MLTRAVQRADCIIEALGLYAFEITPDYVRTPDDIAVCITVKGYPTPYRQAYIKRPDVRYAIIEIEEVIACMKKNVNRNSGFIIVNITIDSYVSVTFTGIDKTTQSQTAVKSKG